MVYRGRPSGNCECCRKARAKCDQGRPSCSRCLRMDIPCNGYRDLGSLVVCDETEKVKNKHIQQEVRLSMKPIRLDIGLALAYCSEDTAVWSFYHTTMSSLSKADHAYRLHCELPRLYSQSPLSSTLRLSTQAIAYAVTSKSNRLAAGSARKSCAHAMAAMRTTLRDTGKGSTDETLYAVLLLCGYETITCGSANLGGWAAHVKGAAALLVQREKHELTQSFTLGLYHFARRSIILYYIQSCTSFAQVFSGLGDTSSLDRSDEDRLFSLMARLSDIQQRCRIINTQFLVDQNENPIVLLRDARELDLRFMRWQENLSPRWVFREARSLNDHHSPKPKMHFAPNEIHMYQDVYIGRMWNLYRVSRIILLSLAIRLQRHTSGSWLATKTVIEVGDMQAIILELVNDICASVPFLSGDCLSRAWSGKFAHVQAAGATAHESPSQQEGTTSGRYSLLWPLYVASSVESIPEPQRTWMREHMLTFSKADEPLAAFLTASSCQNLVGKAENFTFDCV